MGAKRMTSFKKGSKVEWKWGKGTAEGKVEARYAEKVTKKIEGKSITRNASKDEPAYLVKQDDGKRALKSGSELHKA
jgi:hypothetical protein